MVEQEKETTKKPSEHYIDFNLTVKEVIDEIRGNFPPNMKECQESQFVKNSRTFVNSLVTDPVKMDQVLQTVPRSCRHCKQDLQDWKHKPPKSYFLSMGHIKEIKICVKVCPDCRRAYYPQFYQNGILFVHNKFMLSIEAILDFGQILQTGGGFIEAMKKKFLLLGQVEGLDCETLETNLNNTALYIEKIVIATLSIILKGSDMDEVMCYICGNCPKICCTDGNAKVKLIINTSLVAKGALTHRLQRLTTCQVQNDHHLSEKRQILSFWTFSSTFAKEVF